jgi:25S rRNA (cytosine2870-C5)-methyltransferase
MGAKRKQSAGKKKKEAKPPPPPPPSSSSDDEEASSSDDEETRVLTKGEEHEDNSTSDEDESSKEEHNGETGFTDDNAKWLKPKQAKKKNKEQLLSSDDDEQDDDESEEEDAEEDHADDDDELLDIEKEADLVDAEARLEQEEADEEMRRTVAEHTAIYHLPTADELLMDVDRVVPPSELRAHVESILEVLADFKVRHEEGRSRKEYLDTLATFLAELFGYLPELVQYFLTMFSPPEAVEFIDASDKPRPLVIRTNTLKTRRKDLAAALIKRGVSLDPLANWSKVGLKIVESPVPVGATPEYLAGHYMLQSAASMCPVMALSPQPNERNLDMSAAPGGKTSYMAQLMKNTGWIVANDLSVERQKATVANLHRLGVKNVLTCAQDGRKMNFQNRFDRILLDAPCSGLGVISRDPSVKVQRTINDVKNCAHLQKELLLAAIDALKWKNTTGGVMVYSTCSVSVFENEEVVQYAVQKRDIQIIETGLDFGTPGFTRYQQKRFHPSMALTRRFYPHTVNMDGFFVCKIKKLSDKKKDEASKDEKELGEADGTDETKEEVEEKKATEPVEGKKVAVGMKHRDKGKRKSDANAAVGDLKKVRVAAPAAKPAAKKEKTNAKVTKPRRPKKGAQDA